MMTTSKKRLIGLLLTLSLVLSCLPAAAVTVDDTGLCEHHAEHTADCGFVEGASACGYVCENCAQGEKETTEPEATEETDDSLIGDVQTLDTFPLANGDDISSGYYQGAMPSKGNPNILVFYVTIPGGTQRWELDRAGVEDLFFSETGESLRTFYERSSYGKVHIEGTVYEYTTQHDIYHYTDAVMILDEIIEQYQSTINWDDYDSDKDGYIDGIYIVAKTDVIWPGVGSVVGKYVRSAGDLSTSSYCFLSHESALYHETCNMFGMPDIYVGTALNPQGTNTSGIMDDGPGDIPGIMKYALGWIDNPIFISGTGTTELTLRSISTNGEMAIVYPNGDTGNNNWLLIEYLTEEANNAFSGVRIWKSKVFVDEEDDVTGFGYLEAISPFGETNYYFHAGEAVTPYTYPSTSYGVTYRSAGGIFTTNTYFDEIGFSGISISVNSTNDEYAELTISIDNTIKDVEGTAAFVPAASASDIIVDSTKMLIATVKSEVEMMLTGEITLTDNDSGTVIPVNPVLNEYSNVLYIYVDEAYHDLLESNKTYQINLNDTVKTYYGSDIAFKDYDGTVKISVLGRSIQTVATLEAPYFGLADFYTPDVFKIDSTHVMHFGYLGDVLFMRTLDITTQQYTDMPVALNPAPGELQIDKVLQIDGKYYAVLLRNGLGERCIRHIAVYDLGGQLIDEYTPTNILYYVGGNGHPVVVEDHVEGKAKSLKIKKGQLVLETINYPYRMWDATKASQFKLTDTIYVHAEREYVPLAHTKLTFITDAGDVLKVLEYDNVRDVDLVYKEDKLYVLTVGEDLALHIYDRSFALIEERVLLEQTNMEHTGELKLGIVDNSVWVSFYATSAINLVDYYNSYLLVFTPNMVPQYYRYGDTTTTTVGNFVYLGDGVFYMGTQHPGFVLKAVVDDHDYTCTSSVVAPTCTDKGYTHYTCTCCGESYADNYTDALGHSWIDGGDGAKVCSVCGVSGYIVTLKTGDLNGAKSVWVDGVEYSFTANGDDCCINLPDKDATNLVVFTYNDPNAADVHTQYPTGMRVWMLQYNDAAKTYTAKYISKFDNLLQYSGSSIRIAGVKGIRMITSIEKTKKNALIGNGLAGYNLVEYGTLLAQTSKMGDGPLVLGMDYSKSNYAYKKGVADPIFASTTNTIQYTNVLVGFNMDQCKEDIAMRPYLIVEDAQGNQVTIYGGTIYRSIGYIAYQNRNVFKPNTGSYNYVWEIIHHVYGNKYDAEYKG